MIKQDRPEIIKENRGGEIHLKLLLISREKGEKPHKKGINRRGKRKRAKKLKK